MDSTVRIERRGEERRVGYARIGQDGLGTGQYSVVVVVVVTLRTGQHLAQPAHEHRRKCERRPPSQATDGHAQCFCASRLSLGFVSNPVDSVANRNGRLTLSNTKQVHRASKRAVAEMTARGESGLLVQREVAKRYGKCGIIPGIGIEMLKMRWNWC